MSTKSKDNLLTELQAVVQELARPIDFESLEAKGVISKAGAWYRVHKVQDLPEHASRKITERAQDTRGLKVKFEGQGSYERLAKKLGLPLAK